MNFKKIIYHINRYVTTGIIDDSIIEFYDQNGNWRGNTILRKNHAVDEIEGVMKKSYLPESKRVVHSKTGSYLRTSYVCNDGNLVKIDHAEILGSLIVFNNEPIEAPFLRRVHGNIVANTWDKIELPLLETVGGHLELLHSSRLTAPNLRSVQGDVVLADNLPQFLAIIGGRCAVYRHINFESTSLRWIGGSLVLYKANRVDLPVLETVGGGLLLGHRATRIYAPRLKSVADDFLAGWASEIITPSLRYVGKNFETRYAKGYYHPSIKVQGTWITYPDAISNYEKNIGRLNEGKTIYI